MPLRMRGVRGEVRAGYKVAAQLGEWNMDESGRVEATPDEINEYWLDQTNKHSLWLWIGKRAWVWHEAEVVDRGTPFIVRVIGSPVVRDI